MKTGTWKANGLSAEVRIIREHPHTPGWWWVECVSGRHWVPAAELVFN